MKRTLALNIVAALGALLLFVVCFVFLQHSSVRIPPHVASLFAIGAALLLFVVNGVRHWRRH